MEQPSSWRELLKSIISDPAERERIQQQMRTWTQLTPAERQAARERYKSLKQLPPEKRAEVREKWQQYQELPPEKREELAKPPPPSNVFAKPPYRSPTKSTPAPAGSPATVPT